MRHNITKIWMATIELMGKKPIVILPFVIIAFLESIALELIYFSTRFPVSAAANPIIRKFFGEPFVHYPGNLIILSKLFYYAQIVIFVSIGAALTAVTVNIFKNIKEGLPVRFDAMFKNALKNYFGYLGYGLLIVILLFLSNKAEMFLVSKTILKASKFLPQAVIAALSFSGMFFVFLTNVIIYTFLISTVPLIVMGKRSLLKSLGLSIYIGARNFFKIFPLILLPFITYLPFNLLKGFPNELANKLFPEANLIVCALGVIVTIFIDCFMILSVSQWLIDNKKESKITD